MSAASKPRATAATLMALGDAPYEVHAGELVQKADASAERAADRIVDPTTETLTVHRLTPDGYLIALRAERGQVVRAEPFDAVELRVGTLFGED